MRVLVTGGDGFVGQHLIEHILDGGHEVTATMLGESPGRGGLSAAARDGVEWCRLEVRDPAAVASVVRRARPRRIFHLAGCASSVEARANAREALRVNAAGTLGVIWAAARARTQVEHVVVAGSADAYGHGGEAPIGEETPLRPVSAYGATKAAQEVVARGSGAAMGVSVLVGRLFPLAGPGQRSPFVLPSLCRRVLALRRQSAAPRLAVGNLDVARDFTDVRDGVRALARIAELDGPRHRTYNVCSGTATTIRRLLGWLLESAGIEPRIVQDPALVRVGEPESVVGDPSRVRAATGWRVERDLRACAADTMAWVAAEGSHDASVTVA